MGVTRAVLSEDPYADGDRQKQDEAMSLERAGPRRPYSTTAPHGGAIFPLDTELWTPRSYMLGPLFSAVEVARERLNRMLDSAKIRVCFFADTGRAIRKESSPTPE